MRIFYRLSLFFISIFCLIGIYSIYYTGGENLPKNFDYGRIEDNIYINDFFEMQVELPGDWVVQSKQEINSMKQRGHAHYSSDKNKSDSVFNGAEQDIANLLSIYRYPQDSKNFNYSFQMVAQINRDANIKNGKDVLLLLKKLLSEAETKFKFEKEIYKHKFGTRNFYVLESEALLSGNIIKQESYAGILNGFSLSIILSYTNENQKNELHLIIDKIKFKTL